MIYYVIDTTVPVTQEEFNLYKINGALQDSISTIRLSLDGTKGILKSHNDLSQIITRTIHFMGNLDAIHQYLQNNQSEWFIEGTI